MVQLWHQQDSGGKIRDNRQFARLSYFLMETGEFTELKEVVKYPLGIDKLPIFCIFHDKSRVLMNVIASTVTCGGTRLVESFSKLVERREAVKLYLAHKLAGFFLLSSFEYLRVPLQARALETGTGYTRVPEIDSQAVQALYYTRVTCTCLSSYL